MRGNHGDEIVVEGLMRYLISLTFAAALLAGCAQPPDIAVRSVQDKGSKKAAIYEAVLRRYLTTPNENSFSETTFKTVYVLDRAYPNAGEPSGEKGEAVEIAREDQDRITAGLASQATVRFIADGQTVLDQSDGCAKVKDGGILITLGTPRSGAGTELNVGINGFVACLGATWLTYVVDNPSGTEWTVTGTTGPMAIS
jgi:hypothetical protein